MLPPTHLIFAVLVMSVACHSARAQDDIKLPTLETRGNRHRGLCGLLSDTRALVRLGLTDRTEEGRTAMLETVRP